MKKHIYSLLAVVVAIGDAVAGIRVGNLSRNYAGSYKNTAALEQQYNNSVAAAAQEDVVVDVELPVRVANKELAEQVKRGDENAKTNIETLTKCASIYPDGEFVWDIPTLGRGAGGQATCVAVVEMRALGSNGGLEYTTVARGKLAAGDMVHCNISDFAESTYLPDITKVTFPADERPTREDVVKVMNEEQKSKAGLKIAAAALVGGLGGNFVGKSAPGEDKMLGTNKEKMKTTAIGAAAGAALMAASTFSGKVAGDVILHTGVNAAAGGVIGNLTQTGDDVLRVEKCTYNSIETTCLWGTLTKTEDITSENLDGVFSDVSGKNVFTCKRNENGEKISCRKRSDLVVKTVADKPLGTYGRADLVPITDVKQKYYFHREITQITDLNDASSKEADDNNLYFMASAEKKAGLGQQAVVVDYKEGAFGNKTDTWESWKAGNKKATFCLRDTKGNPVADQCNDKLSKGKDNEGNDIPYTLDDFNPKFLSADDGSVIDFSNKARLGSTVKGAGVGGAMGAFSGYQGAQADIEDRLTQAIREYNDSLEKIYCGTGKKFLSFYNDDAGIPPMKN
ncbi:MAG: hypothetical protein IKS08_01930 [Alphaproteobacteria bacterium]|nr:hypothetical protein [Alphaproteobacteria bacterium]